MRLKQSKTTTHGDSIETQKVVQSARHEKQIETLSKEEKIPASRSPIFTVPLAQPLTNANIEQTTQIHVQAQSLAEPSGRISCINELKDILELHSDAEVQDFLASLILSELAYQKLDKDSDQLATKCSELLSFFPPGSVSIDSIQSSISDSSQHYLIATGHDALYVSFMGTKQARDLMSDLSFLHEPIWKEAIDLAKDSKSVPAAHAGFLKRARAVNIEQLNDLASQSGRRLVLCGHSLGGAVAKLTALRLLREVPEWPVPSLKCICFATPAVGNASLASLVKSAGWASHFKTYFLPEDQLMRLVGFSQRRTETASQPLPTIDLQSPSSLADGTMTMDGADEAAIEDILSTPPGLVTSRSLPNLSTLTDHLRDSEEDAPSSTHDSSSQPQKFNLGLTIALQRKQAERVIKRVADRIKVPLPPLRPFHTFGDQLTVFPDRLVPSANSNSLDLHKKRSTETDPCPFDFSSVVSGPFSHHRMMAFRFRVLGLIASTCSSEEREGAVERLTRAASSLTPPSDTLSPSSATIPETSINQRCHSKDLFPRISVDSTSSRPPILLPTSPSDETLVPLIVHVQGQHLHLCTRVQATLSSESKEGTRPPVELKTQVIKVIKPAPTSLGGGGGGGRHNHLSTFSPLSIIQRVGQYILPQARQGLAVEPDASTCITVQVLIPQHTLTRLFQSSSLIPQCQGQGGGPRLILSLRSDFHEASAAVNIQPLKAACLGTSALAATLLQAALAPSSAPSSKLSSQTDGLVGLVAGAATAVIRRGYSATAVVWSALAPQPLQWAAKQIWSGHSTGLDTSKPGVDSSPPSQDASSPSSPSSPSPPPSSTPTPRPRSLSPSPSLVRLSSRSPSLSASRDRWRLLRQRRIQAFLFPVTTLFFMAQLLRQTALSLVMARAAAAAASREGGEPEKTNAGGLRSFVFLRKRGVAAARSTRVSASGGSELINNQVVSRAIGDTDHNMRMVEGVGGGGLGRGAASAWPFRLVSSGLRGAGWGIQSAAGSSWTFHPLRLRAMTSSSAQATLHPSPPAEVISDANPLELLKPLLSAAPSNLSSPSFTRPSTPKIQIDLDDSPLLHSFLSDGCLEDMESRSATPSQGHIVERLLLESDKLRESPSASLTSRHRSVSFPSLNSSSSFNENGADSTGIKIETSSSGSRLNQDELLKGEDAKEHGEEAHLPLLVPQSRTTLSYSRRRSQNLPRPKWSQQVAVATALDIPHASPCFGGSLVVHNVLASADANGQSVASTPHNPHTKFASPFVVLRALAASLRRQAGRQRRSSWWGIMHDRAIDSFGSEEEQGSHQPKPMSSPSLLPALPHVHLYNLLRGIPLWLQQKRSKGILSFDQEWKVVIVAASALDPVRLLKGRDFARMTMRARTASVDLLPVLFISPSVPPAQKEQALQTLALSCGVSFESVRVVSVDDRLLLTSVGVASQSQGLSSGDEARRMASEAQGVEELKKQLQSLLASS